MTTRTLRSRMPESPTLKGFIMKRATSGVWRMGTAVMAIPVFFALAAGAIQPAGAAAPARSEAAEMWRPTACPPPAERGSGPSSLKVTGPCAFEYKGVAECESAHDDFMVTVARKAKNGAELMLHINVERYIGPGKYKSPNDVFVGLKDGTKIYRWFSNDFEVTVGPQSRSVTLRDVRLAPELVLVGCTGPQTNYQCDGRGDEPMHMKTAATVSGTIYCKVRAAKN